MDTDTDETTVVDTEGRLAGLDPGDAREHRIERDGGLDLVFDGWIVGTAEHGTGGLFSKDWTRGVIVALYLTRGAQIVTSVKRWSKWEGEGDRWAAAVHASPEAALAWLVADAGGELGPASKQAWEQACETAPGLSGSDVEVVS